MSEYGLGKVALKLKHLKARTVQKSKEWLGLPWGSRDE